MGITQHLLVVVISWMLPAECDQKTLELPNGNQIAYVRCGYPHQETIVFLHAGGLDHRMWAPQIDHFSDQYQVIAYDIRGHGSSTFLDNTPEEADDLLSILEEEGLNKVHLVGCSLGSVIALDVAIRHPELIRKLILTSPGLLGRQDKDPAFLQQMTTYVELLQKGDFTALAAHLKTMNATGAGLRPLPVPVDRYVDTLLQKFVRGPGLTRIPRLSIATPTDSLSTLTVPTLLLVGRQDNGYIQDNALYLQKHLPNSTLRIIRKTGHLPSLEKPRRYNRLLDRFLSDGHK